MAALRQDYLLTQIELLRQFVARLLHSKDRAGLEEALRLTLGLQEKLFPLPAAEFLALTVEEQLAALQAGESTARSREKIFFYAQLLQATASLYDFRGRPDLAAGARQLALHVALRLAEEAPPTTELSALITDLRSHLALEDLHPPVRESLQAFDNPTAG